MTKDSVQKSETFKCNLPVLPVVSHGTEITQPQKQTYECSKLTHFVPSIDSMEKGQTYKPLLSRQLITVGVR